MLTSIRVPRLPRASRGYARGLTLVELMVALTIGMLVTLVAASTLLFARRGLDTQRTENDLRENTRFTVDLMGRIISQAGYETTQNTRGELGYGIEPAVDGANNAQFNATGMSFGTGNGLQGSDAIRVAFQGSSLDSTPGVADGTVIDCSGGGVAGPVAGVTGDTRQVSVFHIVTAPSGEPSLACSWGPVGGPLTTRVLIEGVEDLQVLYAAGGVTPGTAPTIPTKGQVNLSPSTDRYLRADQFASTSTAATNVNWGHVTAVRIGLVLRADPRTSPLTTNQDWYPLGAAAYAAADPGTKLTAGSDGRRRQSIGFTVFLRNPQLADLK